MAGVIIGGHDPVQVLKQYPTRIVMMHVKDFKDAKEPSVELGTGSIDYTPIFAAAVAGKHIRHCLCGAGRISESHHAVVWASMLSI